MDFIRTLDLISVLSKRSAFLFGPRGTGKTTLILKQLPTSNVYDLLDEQTYLRLTKDSNILEQENPHENSLIVIDEIQKTPKLLDEVQRLMTKKKHRFLLTGSSARKLKREGVNLLGGRARELRLFPLTWKELSDSFDLLQYLNRGGLPSIYTSDEPTEDLRSYIGLYLREEVAAEALTRRVDQFARFLDTLALTNGEELHFQNLSNDSGVQARTLMNYIEILEDTLIGFKLLPYETSKRKAISKSKFYFFDVGVTRVLSRRGEISDGDPLFGRAFEHWIALELRAALEYLRIDLPLQYWRTKTGFEVDFILGDHTAIEVKASTSVTVKHLKGLKALKEEGKFKNYLLISRDVQERQIEGIRIIPWEKALAELWAGAWF
jgi:predicted AAA+ superfamily ATPase